ncbi:MAG: aconitate hydratase, partial [Candidatus Goldbacteria bacterium]|nr:aconitate hydratase [Candidatus Goldiibacteriota bacterium]
SHTPTAGGIGMIAIGVGGMDIAAALVGYPFFLTCPEVIGVKLKGKLKPWSTAKDVILHLLQILTVKGGVGKIFEYFGDGVKTLSVPERATITNMGAELGATTSIFPSDEVTYKFLKSFGRKKDYKKLLADDNAQYSKIIDIDLSKIEPMIALPHMPDNVKKVKEVEGIKVNQVIIGSCTNSSYKDLMTAASILKNKKIHKDVSFVVAPGSKTILNALIKNKHLSYFLNAGARIIEAACGPCIGMGQAPCSKGVTLRTFNRNFKGRSGTQDADVYLVSVETAVAAAIYGRITDPRKLGKYPVIKEPTKIILDDSLLLKPLPPTKRKSIEIIMGPNIKPLPEDKPIPNKIETKILAKFGDNITTDDIMPAGAKILPLRSNIPEISKYIFSKILPDFYKKAIEAKGGIIVGGENYGQGSSREHAALAPQHLNIKVVIAKSFARIHKANLINCGILPLTFITPSDYDKINPGDSIVLDNIIESLKQKKNINVLLNNNLSIELAYNLTDTEIEIILAGGKINYIKKYINEN